MSCVGFCCVSFASHVSRSMGRKGWTTMDIPSSSDPWSEVAFLAWPQVQGGRQPCADSQNRGPGAQQRRTLSGGAKRGSTPQPPPLSVRGRRPSRSVPMHPPKCLYAGRVKFFRKRGRGRETLALVKAQKQSEELPVGQMEIMK